MSNEKFSSRILRLSGSARFGTPFWQQLDIPALHVQPQVCPVAVAQNKVGHGLAVAIELVAFARLGGAAKAWRIQRVDDGLDAYGIGCAQCPCRGALGIGLIAQ